MGELQSPRGHHSNGVLSLDDTKEPTANPVTSKHPAAIVSNASVSLLPQLPLRGPNYQLAHPYRNAVVWRVGCDSARLLLGVAICRGRQATRTQRLGAAQAPARLSYNFRTALSSEETTTCVGCSCSRYP